MPGNMFLTAYHRAVEEKAKKSEKVVEVEQTSTTEKDEKPKTVKRKPKK